MNAIKCDRCGEYCGGGCFTDHQIIKNKGICVGDNVAVYLCGDCQQQLEQWLNFYKTTERPTPPTTGSNIQNASRLTADERFAVILGELAETLAAKKREIAELLAKFDDLAQELAVTQSQLEEARKRLKRYEGGGE